MSEPALRCLLSNKLSPHHPSCFLTTVHPCRCCRQHGALGFNGIARTEAEELANRVAALEAQARCRRHSCACRLLLLRPAALLRLNRVACMDKDRKLPGRISSTLHCTHPSHCRHLSPARLRHYANRRYCIQPTLPLQLAESEQQYAEIYDAFENAKEFYGGIEAAMHKAQQVKAGGGCWVLGWRGWLQAPLCSGWVVPATPSEPLAGVTVAACPHLRATNRQPTLLPACQSFCLTARQQEYMREQRQWKEATAADARRLADLEQQLGAERAGRDAAETQLAVLQVGGGWADGECPLLGPLRPEHVGRLVGGMACAAKIALRPSAHRLTCTYPDRPLFSHCVEKTGQGAAAGV